MASKKLDIKLIAASSPDENRLSRFINKVVDITLHEGPRISGVLTLNDKSEFLLDLLSNGGNDSINLVIKPEHVKYIKLQGGH